MTSISQKFGLGSGGGVHFTNPGEFLPCCATATSLNVADSGGSARASDTTAFFTEMARRGVQDQTNWTANTYKTILSVSGGGLMGAYVGCTAGGAETHTVRITVDGTATEMTISGLASGERGCLVTALVQFGTLTPYLPGAEALDATKDIFGAVFLGSTIPAWSGQSFWATPMLKFERSLLVEAKHSATITNSTATAYSGVMYRKFLVS